MRINYAAKTDVGMKRDNNEDNLLVFPEQNVFAVFDGMGGHAAGEVASAIAVNEVKEFFTYTGKDEDATWPFKAERDKNYDEALSHALDEGQDPLPLLQRIGQVRRRIADAGGIGTARAAREPDIPVVRDRDLGMRQIFRYVDVHRAWPPLERQVDRLLEHVAGAGRIGQHVGALGRSCEHSLGVGGPARAGGLVQGALSLPLPIREPGDREHRIRIGHRNRQSGEEVEGARPRGCETEP